MLICLSVGRIFVYRMVPVARVLYRPHPLILSNNSSNRTVPRSYALRKKKKKTQTMVGMYMLCVLVFSVLRRFPGGGPLGFSTGWPMKMGVSCDRQKKVSVGFCSRMRLEECLRARLDGGRRGALTSPEGRLGAQGACDLDVLAEHRWSLTTVEVATLATLQVHGGNGTGAPKRKEPWGDGFVDARHAELL